MTVDLERQLRIPPHIIQTSLRPDVILVSEATKQLCLLELTVPWEERMEEEHERGRSTRSWWTSVGGTDGGPGVCQWRWAVGVSLATP